jgi:flagellar FliL protein
MAEEDLDEELEEAADGEDVDGDGAASSGGKKRLLIIVAAVLLLIVGGGAGAFFTGLLDPLLGGGDHMAEGEGEGEEQAAATQSVFFELPEMLVNLNTGQRKSTFLKIKVSLELPNAEMIPRIQAIMPRIIDNFQVYLRELRLEDLKGSAGMYRLREELLTRVNAAANPATVNDVLFKEMLVQ